MDYEACSHTHIDFPGCIYGAITNRWPFPRLLQRLRNQLPLNLFGSIKLYPISLQCSLYFFSTIFATLKHSKFSLQWRYAMKLALKVLKYAFLLPVYTKIFCELFYIFLQVRHNIWANFGFWFPQSFNFFSVSRRACIILIALYTSQYVSINFPFHFIKHILHITVWILFILNNGLYLRAFSWKTLSVLNIIWSPAKRYFIANTLVLTIKISFH